VNAFYLSHPRHPFVYCQVYSSGDADYDEFLMKVMIGVATVVENNNCICQDLVPASQS
jgi:hypothetical protein